MLPPPKPRDRFILCIDGGGMRGIIPVIILQHLGTYLRENGLTGSPKRYFDMVAGTSTGGLIALTLTCKQNTDLQDLLDTYMTMGPRIFPARTGDFLNLRMLHTDKYPSYGIEGMLNEWFGDIKLNEASIPTLVTAYNLASGREAIFKSWEDSEVLAREAARATSAAPTYFPPLYRNGQILVDGGVIANNPSLYAWTEAKKLWATGGKFRILSIGTAGNIHTMTLSDVSGLLNWIDQVSPMYSTAQKRTVDYVLRQMPDVSYMRIDGQMEQSIPMDDFSPSALKQMLDFGQELAENYSDVLKLYAQQLAENTNAS